MEYLPLGNLAEHISISEWETVTLLCQGLDALDYLHSRKIVHRDLKPENILVQCREPANFCIKIADFGLAKDDSFLKTFCGTRCYAAPEIWQNRPYNSKVDIWSLGLIAFECTYRLPDAPIVEGHFDHERWYEILVQEIDDWESDGLLDFLKSSMLTMDPRMRLTASECLRESTKLLEAIAPAQNLELDPGTPTEPMSSSPSYGGGQQVAAEKAGTRIGLGDIFGSGWRHGWRPEDYPDTMTQIWSPAPDGDYGAEEGERNQPRVQSSVEHDSQARCSKRQRIEQPNDQPLSNDRQTPSRRSADQHLIEEPEYLLVPFTDATVSIRTADSWINATQVAKFAAWDHNDMRKFRKRPGIVFKIVRGFSQPGTYVDPQTGLQLCKEHSLNKLESILRKALEEHGDQRRDLSQRTATALKQTIVEVTASPGARRNHSQNTVVRDDHTNKNRPRCNECIHKHRKCDRGESCGNCIAFKLGNILFLNRF